MAGDIQGNDTNVISNQQGADINYDGNDKKILTEYDAEKSLDELNDIKLITFAEYNALKDSEKAKYVKYNPSLQSMAYGQWIALQRQAIAGFNQIGPAVEKAKVVDNTPIKDLTEQMKPVQETFQSATETINSLTDVEIIGDLAKPVFDVVLALGKLCGFLYSMIANPINMAKAYYDAYESLDMSNYKQLFDNDDPETPNIETMLAEKELEMDKIIIPDKEIKDLYNRQKAELKNEINDVKESSKAVLEEGETTMNTVVKTMEDMDIIMGAMTIGTAITAKKMFELAYEKSKKDTLKDYNKDAEKLAEKINSFESKIPVKYIKSEDLDKIKTQQKTSDKPSDGYNFEYSSDNQDTTEEELQQQYEAAKQQAYENAKKLNDKNKKEKELTTKKSELKDLQDKLERYNTLEADPETPYETLEEINLNKYIIEAKIEQLTREIYGGIDGEGNQVKGLTTEVKELASSLIDEIKLPE